MNSHRNGGSKLPLPKTQSPKNLDDKVLAYANANTPASTSRDYRQWMSGLAFAGIVGIAVVIAVPSFQPSRQSVEYDAPVSPQAQPSPPNASSLSIDGHLPPDAAARDSADEEVMRVRADRGANSVADSVELAPPQSIARKSVAKTESALTQPATAGARLEELAPAPQSHAPIALPNVKDADQDTAAYEQHLKRSSATILGKWQPKKQDSNSGPSKMLLGELVVSAQKRIESKQSTHLSVGDDSKPGALADATADDEASAEDALQDKSVIRSSEQIAHQREAVGISSDSTKESAAAISALSKTDQHTAIEKCSALLSTRPGRPTQAAHPDPNAPAAANTATQRKLAQECYQTLLKRCAECDLPKSLAEARLLISEEQGQ